MLTTLCRQGLALYRDESGSEIMEYALITAVLSMTVAGVFAVISTDANTAITTQLPAVTNSGISPP